MAAPAVTTAARGRTGAAGRGWGRRPPRTGRARASGRGLLTCTSRCRCCGLTRFVTTKTPCVRVCSGDIIMSHGLAFLGEDGVS